MCSTPLAAGLFGLGAPELIVMLIILLVLYSSQRLGQTISKPERKESRLDFSPTDKQVFFGLAAVLLIAVGILVFGGG